MAKGQVLGHAPCPYSCGNESAEVKADKNNNPYLVCFGCGSDKKPATQHFTMGDAALVKRWLAGGKYRPLQGVTQPEWAKSLVPQPAPAKPPAEPEKKKEPGLKTLMG